MDLFKPSWKSTAKAFLYLLPALIIISVFNIYPIIKSLLMSFYADYDFFRDIVYEYGIDNYAYIFQDPDFYLALKNTFIFVLGVVPTSIVISLVIAVFLNSKLKFTGVFRTIYFIPFVTATVAVAIVWRWIFHSEYGLLNYFLSLVGISPVHWLTDPDTALLALIILCVWKSLGFNIIIFLAGLKNIDEQFYLAARVDGASRWQRFKRITLPLLSPTIFFISIMSIIHAFKVFNEVYALFNKHPGPLKSALTLVYYIFEKFYGEWKFEVAAAATYVLFFIIFIFTLLQLYIGKKKVHY